MPRRKREIPPPPPEATFLNDGRGGGILSTRTDLPLSKVRGRRHNRRKDRLAARLPSQEMLIDGERYFTQPLGAEPLRIIGYLRKVAEKHEPLPVMDVNGQYYLFCR